MEMNLLDFVSFVTLIFSVFFCPGVYVRELFVISLDLGLKQQTCEIEAYLFTLVPLPLYDRIRRFIFVEKKIFLAFYFARLFFDWNYSLWIKGST